MSSKLVKIEPLAPPQSDPSKPPATVPAPFLAVVTTIDAPERPVDPGWGVTPPVDPGYGRPVLPPLPGHELPGGGAHPSHPIYHPDKPTPPGEGEPEKPEIWPPIEAPGGGAPGYILVWIPGVGYRWFRIGARPDHSLPGSGAPARPDQGLPPTAQPKK